MAAGCIRSYSTTTRRCTAGQMFRLWRRKFKQNNLDDFNLSAKYLIESVCGRSKQTLLSKEQINAINILGNKRLTRMPVQYLLNEWPFRNASLILRPPVFIPRPETEILVGLILDNIKHTSSRCMKFIDIGCGSGPISISLLQENQQLQGCAIDISRKAVELTHQNALRNGVANRLKVYHTSMEEVCKLIANEKFDFLVSNPPYIKTQDIPTLQTEIINYEDIRAIDGGCDGMHAITQVISTSDSLLAPSGLIWLETGLEQNVRELVNGNFSKLCYKQCYPDLSGRYRFHLLQKAAD